MPTPGQLALLFAAVALFAAGVGVSVARVWHPSAVLRIVGKNCLYWGIVTAVAVLVWHSAHRGHWVPVGDNFDALVWLAVLLAGFTAYVQGTRPMAALDWFLLPVVVALLVAAAVFGRTEYQPYGGRATTYAHLLTSFAAAAAFAVAAAAGAMYLWASGRLRRKRPVGGYLGSLERLERLTMTAVTLGFALLTVGIITGGFEMVRRGISTEPWKVALAVGGWVVYAVVLHAPINPVFRGRRAALLSVVGFALMVGAVLAAQLAGGDPLMHRLHLLGLNHTTAPLAVRERLAFAPPQRAAAMSAFRGRFPDCEAVLLSTCNRVELYVARSAGDRPTAADFADFVAGFHGVPAESFHGHLYHRSARAMVEHLFAVAASLDSMVLGETQILGQVREAYDAARAAGTVGSALNPLFQRAVAVGRQVLRETPLAEGRQSVAGAAVAYAGQVFDGLAGKAVLCIGAGKMARLVLRGFADQSPKRMLVCNRDGAKAAELAREFGGEAAPFEALDDHLAAVDVVITGTGSAEPIVTAARFHAVHKRRRYRPIFLIDIALPRDVEPAVGALENVYLYNLDDLQRVVAATCAGRQESVDDAKRIVATAVDEYVAAHRARGLGPTIDALYRRSHQLAREELERTLNKLPGVTEAERQHLDELARRIVNKLLHDPVQALRQADASHGPQYVHAMEQLFRLPAEISTTETRRHGEEDGTTDAHG